MARKFQSKKLNYPSSTSSSSSKSTVQSNSLENGSRDKNKPKYTKKTFPEVFPEAFSDDEPKEAPRSPRPYRPFRLTKKKKTAGLTFRGKPLKLFDATKPRFESPPDEQGRQERRKSKKKAKQQLAEPETMDAVRNILNWSRATFPNRPGSLKTVIVNNKDGQYQDIASFDSDLVMRHVTKCDHYPYNCKVCNIARHRQESGKTNRNYIGNGKMDPSEPCTCELENQEPVASPCPPTPRSSIYGDRVPETFPEPSESDQGTSKSSSSVEEDKFIGRLKNLEVAGPSGMNKNQSTPVRRQPMNLLHSKPTQASGLRRRYTYQDLRGSSESD